MNNLKAAKLFHNDMHSARIEQLFWLAGSMESSDLKDLIADMDDDDFQKCFPEIQLPYCEDDTTRRMELLSDANKYGLLAQVYVPEAYNFSYDGEGLKSWSLRLGICNIAYVYAETLADLLVGIEKATADIFQRYVEKDKRKKIQTTTP